MSRVPAWGMVLAAFTAAVTASAATIYVAPNGEGIAPYTNWPNAAMTITQALAVATNGDRIVVAPGTYTGPVDLGNLEVELVSTYVESQVWAMVENTVIDGLSTATCLRVAGGQTTQTLIQGFTLANGWALSSNAGDPRGGGLQVQYASPRVRDLIIRDCFAEAAGGGAYFAYSKSPVDHVVIESNAATWGGAGLAIYQGTQTLNRLTLAGNQVGLSGGGAQFYQSAVTLRTARIAFNICGGIGGGFYFDAGRAFIENCTIAGNVCTQAAGLALGYQAQVTVRDSILWSNGVHDIEFNPQWTGMSVTGERTVLLGGTNGIFRNGQGSVSWGVGNFSVNPLFADATFTALASASPLRDVGQTTGWMSNTLDLAGAPRVVGGSVDLGAYELQDAAPLALRGVPADTNAVCGAPALVPVVTYVGGCHPPVSTTNSALRLWYRFDNVTNGLAQDSGTGLHGGVATNVVWTSNSWSGGGAAFTSSLATFAINLLNEPNGATALTFGAWIKPAGTGLQGIMGKTASGNDCFYLAISSNGWLDATIVNQSNVIAHARTNGAYVLGGWTHVMGVFDGTKVRLFANGQQVAASQTVPLVPLRSNNVSGALGDTSVGRGWRYTGELDDVRIYSRALSSSEVVAVYRDVRLSETVSTGVCPVVRTRVWTVTNSCGESAAATQVVTTVDLTAPVLLGVPSNRSWACGVDLAWPVVTATDACAGVVTVVTQETILGTCPGSRVRVWSATDACGNHSAATQWVSLVDSPPLTLVNVPASFTAECGTAWSPAVVTATGGCPVTSSLLHLWPLDDQEASNRLVDVRGGLTAYLQPGSATSAAQSVSGRLDRAISFSPSGVWARTTGLLSLTGSVARTAAFWTRLTDTGPGYFFSSGADVTGRGFGAYQNSSGHLAFWGSGSGDLTTSRTLHDGNWHFIALTYGASNLAVYVDGALVSQAPRSLNTSTGLLHFASKPGGLERLRCSLDQFALYSRALGSAEVAGLYAEGLGTLQVAEPLVTFTQQVSGTCSRTFTRTWRAVDGCSVTATAVQVVQLVDSTGPLLSGVPADTALLCGTPLPWPVVTAFDACNSQTVAVATSEVWQGTCPATVLRTWMATDSCGNASMATQTITLLAPEPVQVFGVPGATNLVCGQPLPSATLSTTGGCPGIAGAIRHWPLNDETETNHLDDVIAGDYAKLFGPGNSEPSTAAFGVSGRVGRAIAFTDDSEWAESLQVLPITGALPRTVTCWLRTTSTNGGYVFSLGEDVSGRGFGLYLNGLGRLNFWASNADLSLTNRVGDGQWHFLAASYDGAQVTVFVDGRVAARAARTLNTTAGGFHFMSKPLGTEQLRGTLDNVALFNRALDPVEVEALYAAGSGTEAIAAPVLSMALIPLGGCPPIVARTWTAQDRCGAGAVVTQLITFVDQEAPTLFGVPDPLVLACDTPFPPPAAVVAVDGCSTVAVELVENLPATCPGEGTRVWLATDACGNSTVYTQTITLLAAPVPQLVGVPAFTSVVCGSVPPPANVQAAGDCVVPTLPNLILRYSCDAAGAVIADESGWTNDGVNAGAVADPDGVRAGALYFSGTTRVVQAGFYARHFATNNRTGTFSFWFNQARTGQVAVLANTSGSEHFALQPNRAIRWEHGHQDLLTAPGLFTTGTWHHVAGVLNLDGVSILYVDGQVAATGTLGAVYPGEAADLELAGYNGQLAHYFVGALDEVQVFSRALTTGEVASLYTRPGPPTAVQFAESTAGQCPQLITRVWTASNLCGGVVAATQVIEVLDVAAPQLADVPTNLTLMCGDPLPATGTVTAVDGCSTVAVAFAEIASTGCPGVVTRTWTATDACGNATTATQLITLVARDADGDGLDYFAELGLGTNPDLADSDGDGRPDGREVLRGFDPLSATSFPRVVRNDFDGDGESDLLVYHAAAGTWYALRTNSIPPNQIVQWGWSSATPVLADFDGDAVVDHTVFFPPNGNWYIRRSSSGSLQQLGWGWAETRPVPGDYDGDGQADVAVYHPATGNWYVRRSSNGSLLLQSWGWSATTPVPGDYDGDGTTDFAVYHQATGNWYVRRSSNGSLFQLNWGWSGAQAVPADFDGDGRTDLAVYYPVNGTWYVRRSSDGNLVQQNWGWSTALPAAADYDHDGQADLTVYYPLTGTWYIRLSSTGALRQRGWGWNAALPVLSP